MSEMTTTHASDDTIINDSQLTGFHAFKERISSCCCRIFQKSSNYNLSNLSKDIEHQQDKPSFINQGFQAEKQARLNKLEKIARTLPNATPTRTIQHTNNSKTHSTTIKKVNPNQNKQIVQETTTEDSSEEEEEETSSDESHSSSKQSQNPKTTKRR